MEQDLESPVAGKTEERSGSVLLTYFHGDISSMVDEHFSRALSKAANQKGEHSKSRRKSAQDGLDSSQWKAQSQSGFHSRHSIYPPERLQLGTSREPHSNPHHPTDSAIFWPGGSRQGMTMALPPMVYPPPASTDGLMMAEHQYTNSLLNIIHNDRPNHSSTVVVSHPKQDHIPEWTKYPGFGDQRSSDVNHDPGVQMKDKKDFYWY